jgi:hypothetical protein
MMAFIAMVLWYHLDWIERRREALRTGEVTLVPYLSESIRAPGLLPLFGENGYSLVLARAIQGEDWKQKQLMVAKLFSEARAVAAISPREQADDG